VLIILALAGLIHSVRAGASQIHFFKAYYEPGIGLDEIGTHCDRAIALYPWNYSVCVLAADRYFEKGVNTGPYKEAGESFTISWKWCQRGLALDKYDRRLVLRKAGHKGLNQEGMEEALAIWQEYTDWEYWNPDNHYYLSVIHAHMGNFEQAEKELDLSKGSMYYEEGRNEVARTRRQAILDAIRFQE